MNTKQLSMKMQILAPLCLALLASSLVGCSTRKYSGTTPIYPAMGYMEFGHYPVVNSLQPELKWKEIKTPNQTYELGIWESLGMQALQRKKSWGKPVYFAKDITNPSHTVSSPLKPDKEYHWSVRTREGQTVSPWSSFDEDTFAGLAYAWKKNTAFGFKTPKQ